MTKEELEKATGQELIDERNYCGVDGYYGDYLDDVNAEMLKRFNRLAELEAQIEIDAKQIRALQKQNGELTDKVNDLEEKLANADYQLEGRDNEIRELEAQIEKMKCCYNCSKWNEGLLLCNDSTVRVTTYADYCCEDWEIKEK